MEELVHCKNVFAKNLSVKFCEDGKLIYACPGRLKKFENMPQSQECYHVIHFPTPPDKIKINDVVYKRDGEGLSYGKGKLKIGSFHEITDNEIFFNPTAPIICEGKTMAYLDWTGAVVHSYKDKDAYTYYSYLFSYIYSNVNELADDTIPTFVFANNRLYQAFRDEERARWSSVVKNEKNLTAAKLQTLSKPYIKIKQTIENRRQLALEEKEQKGSKNKSKKEGVGTSTDGKFTL